METGVKPKATKTTKRPREPRKPSVLKDEPIRLDDLIPRDDVRGGRGLFGARGAWSPREKGSR